MMLNKSQKNKILEQILEKLELPESAYERAKDRYDDLGSWFGRNESLIRSNNPHVFPQGSFRLGTAIRPLDEMEEYDLDLSCILRDGITTKTHTQEQVKNLIKEELEKYRIARGIKEPVKSKPRCWRLEYQDGLQFHMDIVPCIPASTGNRETLMKSITAGGTNQDWARQASDLSVNITDDRKSNFKQISDDWQISNPQGYAKWFEERTESSGRKRLMEKALVDDLPLFKRKLPLQRVIQLLKRHRDHMFKGQENMKPISVIITTIAARAYSGENDIEETLTNVLAQMGNYINQHHPRVPNPVDPNEDFADKWRTADGQKLNLEENFWRWLEQAKTDFAYILSTDQAANITLQGFRRFSVSIDEGELAKSLGLVSSTPKSKPHRVEVTSDSAPPWSCKEE